MDIYGFLDSAGIVYQSYQHPAVFTCDEAQQWVPPMEALPTKNLFLRDRKGLRHFLVVVGYETSVDLKELSPMLGANRLILGSADRMLRFLGVEPGSVTILGLVHDCQHGVEVVFDEPIAQAAALRCHPLVNTATLSISQSGIREFLKATGHRLTTLAIPKRL